jgi:hypothetical protein
LPGLTFEGDGAAVLLDGFSCDGKTQTGAPGPGGKIDDVQADATSVQSVAAKLLDENPRNKLFT